MDDTIPDRNDDNLILTEVDQPGSHETERKTKVKGRRVKDDGYPQITPGPIQRMRKSVTVMGDIGGHVGIAEGPGKGGKS